MIYCPHCQRPTARASGDCPHCGRPLSSGGAARRPEGTPKPRPSIGEEPTIVQLDGELPGAPPQTSAAPPPPSPPSSQRPGAEYEPPPDGVRASGLELAVAPSREASAAPLPNAVAVEEEGIIEELAGFAEPGSGPVGAVKYFFAVKKRLKELQARRLEEAKAAEEALERRRQKLVALGRRAHASKISTPSLAPLLDKARVAEGELQGRLRQKEGLKRSYDTQRRQLERELELAREALEPVRGRRDAAAARLAEAEKKRKGIEVQKKRIDIDLRNRDALIAKRQKEYEAATQKEAKQKILDEITALDKDRPAVLLKQDGLGVSLDEAEQECAKLRGELDEVEGELKKKTAAEQAVVKKITDLEQSFVQKDQQAEGEVAAEQEKAEAAWVVVAEEVLASRIASPAIDPIAEHVVKEKRRADEHALKAERIERARSTYDAEAFAKGKRILILAAAVVTALIAGVAAIAVL